MPKKRKSKYSKAYRYSKNTLGLAKTALSVALATKKLLNVEHKFIDSSITNQSITSTFTKMELTNLSQGTSVSSREGDQIKITSILLKYMLKMNSGAGHTQVRAMIVLDKQTNQATIGSLADILQDSSSDDAIVSPLNLDNKYRFKIIYNKVHNMATNSPTFNQYREKYIRKEIKIRYGDNSGTIADLNTNSLYFILVSNETVNSPTATVYIRLRFVDN